MKRFLSFYIFFPFSVRLARLFYPVCIWLSFTLHKIQKTQRKTATKLIRTIFLSVVFVAFKQLLMLTERCQRRLFDNVDNATKTEKKRQRKTCWCRRQFLSFHLPRKITFFFLLFSIFIWVYLGPFRLFALWTFHRNIFADFTFVCVWYYFSSRFECFNNCSFNGSFRLCSFSAYYYYFVAKCTISSANVQNHFLHLFIFVFSTFKTFIEDIFLASL